MFDDWLTHCSRTKRKKSTACYDQHEPFSWCSVRSKLGNPIQSNLIALPVRSQSRTAGGEPVHCRTQRFAICPLSVSFDTSQHLMGMIMAEGEVFCCGETVWGLTQKKTEDFFLRSFNNSLMTHIFQLRQKKQQRAYEQYSLIRDFSQTNAIASAPLPMIS